MRREYWTVLDGSNGHYEISNLGRIRNFRTRVIKKPYRRETGQVVFNISYKDTKRTTIMVSRSVWEHFMYPLKSGEHVGFINENGGCRVDNLHVYTGRKRLPKMPQKTFDKKEKNWDVIVATIKSMCDSYWIRIVKKYGVEIEDLIDETIADIAEDFDFGRNVSNKDFNRKIRCAFNRLKLGQDERFSDYQIGINYTERDLYRANF